MKELPPNNQPQTTGALIVACGVTLVVGVTLLAVGNPSLAAAPLVLSVVTGATYAFLKRSRQSTTTKWKGVYSNQYLFQMGVLGGMTLVAAAALTYRGLLYIRDDSPFLGVVALGGALCLLFLTVLAVGTIVAARRLRTGRGGRFSKKWINEAYRRAAEDTQ